MDPRFVFDWYPITDLVWLSQMDPAGDVRYDFDPAVVLDRPWAARVWDAEHDRVAIVEIDQHVIDEMRAVRADGYVFSVSTAQPVSEQMPEVQDALNAAARRVAARHVTS